MKTSKQTNLHFNFLTEVFLYFAIQILLSWSYDITTSLVQLLPNYENHDFLI